MRKIYSLSVMCILFITSFAQVQSNCESTSDLKYYYTNDVADLAINRLFEINSPDTNQIEIPQIYLDSIWNGLSAIFNVFSIPERDSVFDIYCIHNISFYTSMLLPHIYISLDTSVSWTSNWLDGEIVTGNIKLDELISNYHYSIYSTHPNYASVVLFSDSLINSYAMSENLMSFDGIESAGPYPTTGDGSKMQYTYEEGFQYFSFILAWGDCYAGCIYNHKWNFKVDYSNCIVEYLGLETNFENNLPEPINCNITSINNAEINQNSIVVYPNPSNDLITIKGERIETIKIINGLGESLSSSNPKSNQVTINIHDFESGLYFLKIETDDKEIIRKIIKE